VPVVCGLGNARLVSSGSDAYPFLWFFFDWLC
jgi:hypothetical protein